jgi:uncharacterized protein (DUF58 family)
MLYPDFNELVAFKDWDLDLMQPANRSAKSTICGNHSSPFRGRGLEFDSVREYVPGDDIRNIDWRVTARMGSPHLKLFKEERERPIVICVDMNATMCFGTRNTFKSVQAARVAALLGWQGISQQNRVGVCLFGDVPAGIQVFPPQRTKNSFCSILKIFSHPPLEHYEIALEAALQRICRVAYTGSLVYLISDFIEIDDHFQQKARINQLCKRCDVVFIAINDPADKSVASLGTIRLSGREKEKLIVNTDSSKGRDAFASQWKDNRKKLYEATSKLKIPLIELTTESNIPRDLFLGLKMVAKRRKK